jgi:phytoene dehydrogenase-like protein
VPQPSNHPRRGKACVIGAGPNGLAAAVVLAQAGMDVEVFEAEAEVGGAARTLDLTLPGFHHDFGSAVHPMAAASPFFTSLPLADYGLEWIHPPAPLAHPFDDGTAITLERNLTAAEADLGEDGKAWRALMEPFVSRWPDLAGDILRPIIGWPSHPFLLARFGLTAMLSASHVARRRFRTEHARALFGGLAAHSFLALDQPLSASFGLVLGAVAHAVGWPIPRGGAQSIANALAGYLAHLGGRVTTSTRIRSFSDLPACDLVLCDVTPRQLLALAGHPGNHPLPNRLSPGYRRSLAVSYRYGPAAFKVDYALSRPIPWNAAACLRAGTVHIGGALAEIEASEAAVAAGLHAEKPFTLLAQPTLFDPTRAPAGKHIAWAYCHVPNGSESESDATLDRLESQIERFATGFRDCILARHVSHARRRSKPWTPTSSAATSSAAPSTCASCSSAPPRRQYRTSAPDIYLCSASTPPGGGVHGMCGANAARLALRNLRPDTCLSLVANRIPCRPSGDPREAVKGRVNAREAERGIYILRTLAHRQKDWPRLTSHCPPRSSASLLSWPSPN